VYLNALSASSKWLVLSAEWCPSGNLVFPLPLDGGSFGKIEIFPLTLPSPARGEGKHIEIEKKFPPP
jgi:hypothetical protein